MQQPSPSSCVRACSVTQLCPTVCNPMDYSLPDSSIHGIFQARILEWVTISYSRGSSQHMDQTQVSCVSYIDRWILYHSTTWETLSFFIHTFVKALSMSWRGKPGNCSPWGCKESDTTEWLNWTGPCQIIILKCLCFSPDLISSSMTEIMSCF